MFYKISRVKTIDDFCLWVDFCNGETKLYDVKPIIKKYDLFKNFELITGLFEQVKVDAQGYGVSWNDEIDIACNELFYNGKSMNAVC